MTCQHSNHKGWTKCKQNCGKRTRHKQGEGVGVDNLIATLTKRVSKMVLQHNRTNLLVFIFFSLLFCFFFVFFVFYQIGLIHNKWDRSRNDNNEEYTKYNRKIVGYCGLRYHLSNNDIFEISIRYLVASQRECNTKSWLYSRCADLDKGIHISTIKFDVIQNTKGYFENNSDSHSWYDNLLYQCFKDYEKS